MNFKGSLDEEALALSFEPDLQAARDFYLRLAQRVGGPMLVLEPNGALFADELARVSPRLKCAHRGGGGQWRLPGEGAFRLAVAPLGALEAVGSHRERGHLLGEVFKLLEPEGVFALDLQMPPAAHETDGVSRLIAERRDETSRKFFWENRRFEAGSNRLERRLAVEELTGDGTVRKKRYRCLILALVEPERFRREAVAAGFEAERLSEELFHGEAVAMQTGGAPAEGANATEGAPRRAIVGAQRHLWLLTRPQLCGEGQAPPSGGEAT